VEFSAQPEDSAATACIDQTLGLPDIRQAFLFGKIVILTLTWITSAPARMIIDAKLRTIYR